MPRSTTALVSLALCALNGCGGIAVIDGDDGSSSQSSGKSSSASGGGNAVGVSLTEAIGRANCQSPAADTLQLSFTLRFENETSQTVVVTIAGARLTGEAGVTSFTVNPSSSGPIASNSSATVDFEKVAGSASGPASCAWCDVTDARVELDLVVDGKPLTPPFAEDIDSISCSF
jgi:hypothetical protein